MYKFESTECVSVKNTITGVTNIFPGTWQWKMYQDWLDEGNDTEPFQTDEEIANLKAIEDEKAVRDAFEKESESAVTVEIDEGTFTFNGGQDSASYIQGAVGLAQALGESTVTITDVDNIRREMSFGSALIVAALIGKSFRTAFFKKQDALVEIKKRRKDV